PLLRALTFFLLIGMLSQPVLNHKWIEGKLKRLDIMVDMSRSMGVVDSSSSDSRIQRVADWLLGRSSSPNLTSFLERLRTSYEIRLFDLRGKLIWSSSFDSALPTRDHFSAQQQTTPLGIALQERLRQSQTTDGPARSTIDTLILVTDGQDNQSVSPMDAIRSNLPEGCRMVTIGVGDEAEPLDLAILAADISTHVRPEDRLRGVLTIKEQVPAGTRYRLRVMHSGKDLHSKEIISAQRSIFEYEFDTPIDTVFEQKTIRPDPNLEHRAIPIDLECQIETTEGELTRENNHFLTSTWGVIKRNRILLLDPRGRWETRYIRNALERDPTWSVQSALGPKIFESDFFPKSRKDLLDFDLIIATLDSVTALDDVQASWFTSFVGETSGGIVWIDGNRSHISLAHPIGSIVPIEPIEPNSKSDPSTDLQRLSWQLTATGVKQPAFRLGTGESSPEKIWTELPVPHAYRTIRVKPGAESCAELIRGRETAVPMIVTSLFGQGRVVYFATDETWRWRYSVADLYHQRFWSQIATWCMRTPFVVSGDFIALDAGKRIYRPEEQVVVRAKLLDDRRQPLENALVHMIVSNNDKVIARIPMESVSSSTGMYTGVLGPFLNSDMKAQFTPDIYRVQVETSGVPPNALGVSTSFQLVSTVDIEMERLACNRALLEEMASVGSGKYLPLTDADQVIVELENSSTGRIVEQDTLLWQSFPWFVAIMGLLTMEWIARRRCGAI
ncbi:MAG: hypothetical protein KGQ60_08340, partial [Planctomycetes bacterium]|nr:hypothetical protein [Planctomycetota bacterium]